MSGFLLDTDVVSEPTRLRPNPAVVDRLGRVDPERTFLSAMTPAEIRAGIVRVRDGRRAARLEAWLAEVREAFGERILPLDDGVLDRWGRLVGSAMAGGAPLPGIDALFAATALHHNLVLVTRSTRHMAAAGIDVLKPWDEGP
ncbi:MAG TPA: type II toxin-antitoxin system VapC family toxin [Geminicoccaceae bacterium]|nr:type II toxin-antitoxin system VapC family toxin [Geminicoccaceae bacterium]